MKNLKDNSARKAVVEYFLKERIKHFHIRKTEVFISKRLEDEKAWKNNDSTLKKSIN